MTVKRVAAGSGEGMDGVKGCRVVGCSNKSKKRQQKAWLLVAASLLTQWWSIKANSREGAMGCGKQ